MQIALTKKLASAMGVKPFPANDDAEPLFSWTANWTNTFDRRQEDMVVLVNRATRFTVTIFGVKRNQFHDISAKMTAAIRNTLTDMNINPEIIDEYMQRAGEPEFFSNHDRSMGAWVQRNGLNAALYIGRVANETHGRLTFDDSMGHILSRRMVNYANSNAERFVPAEKMAAALADLTGKPAYKYRAFELLAALDLDVYKATRRLIVPADIRFFRLHTLLQHVFGWHNRHTHDFAIFDEKTGNCITRLVMDKEVMVHDAKAVLSFMYKLSDFFPKHKNIRYTYDRGSNWVHEIECVREIKEHNEESPYLLEAVGQTPPEDIGGIPGFVAFREIMLNPAHPDYASTKERARHWSPELRKWNTPPGPIHP